MQIIIHTLTILIHTLTISLWCCGFFAITDEGQILSFITQWAKKFQGIKRKLLKPVVLCVTCMASLHGIIVSLLLQVDIITALISIMCAAFLNTLFWNIYKNNL